VHNPPARNTFVTLTFQLDGEHRSHRDLRIDHLEISDVGDGKRITGTHQMRGSLSSGVRVFGPSVRISEFGCADVRVRVYLSGYTGVRSGVRVSEFGVRVCGCAGPGIPYPA
jgi:hypothetical protein